MPNPNHDFVVKNGLVVNTNLIFANTGKVGINNSAPDAALAVTGTANVSGNVALGADLTVAGKFLLSNTLTVNSTANVYGDVFVSGNLTVNGSFTYIGNQIANGDIIPYSNGYVLGNTSNRWTMFGNTVSVSNTISIGLGTQNVAISSQSISIGNSSVNVSINSTSFSGSAAQAANATNLNGQPASYYTNATNLATGTINTARISGSYTGITAVGNLAGLVATGNVNFDSGVLFVDGTNNRVGIGNTAPSVALEITATDAIMVPSGNTGQRPTGANGFIRYNTESKQFEGYANGAWGAIAGTGGAYFKGNLGTVGSVTDKENLYKLNSNTQTANVTISAGENAMTVGPMQIQTGSTLVVETGARMVVI